MEVKALNSTFCPPTFTSQGPIKSTQTSFQGKKGACLAGRLPYPGPGNLFNSHSLQCYRIQRYLSPGI